MLFYDTDDEAEEAVQRSGGCRFRMTCECGYKWHCIVEVPELALIMLGIDPMHGLDAIQNPHEFNYTGDLGAFEPCLTCPTCGLHSYAGELTPAKASRVMQQNLTSGLVSSKQVADWVNEATSWRTDLFGGDLEMFRATQAACVWFCDVVRGSTAGWMEPTIEMMALGRLSELFVWHTQFTPRLKDALISLHSNAPAERRALMRRGYGTLSEVVGLELTGHIAASVLALWFRGGFPVVEIPHKLAASMMFTDGADYVELPWPTFVVRIPPGLVSGDRGEDLRQVWLARIPAENCSNLAEQQYELCMRFVCPNQPIDRSEYNCFIGLNSLTEKATYDAFCMQQEMFSKRDDEQRAPFSSPDAMGRAGVLIMNLLKGVCSLVASDHAQIRSRPVTWSRHRNRPPGVGPDDQAIVMLSKAVELDLRAQVHEYVANKTTAKRGPLSVQFVVRGHQRNQACGPRWSQHKLIWVEPHWKGRTDAPIVAHSGGDDGES